MATIKSFTSLEQSKVLANILSHETADMWWLYVTSQGKHIAMMYEEPDPRYLARMESYGIKDAAIRCWSLAALVGVVEIDKSEICFDCYGEKYRVNIHYQTLGSFCQDNELYESKIDALFAMIIKLHKRNLL